MSLPIDIGSSLWIMPTAIWEWEPDPAAAPGGEGQATAAASGATPADVACGEPQAQPPMRQVFKGYAIDAAFHWFAADTVLSRPWSHVQIDDSHRHHVVPSRVLPQPATPADDDADPPC